MLERLNNIAPVQESMLVTKRQENNTELAQQLGNPTRLFYPSGRFDFYHLLMPSAEVLAIVEVVPLLLDHEAVTNTYSSTLRQILSTQQGHYIPFTDMLKNPLLGQNQQEDLYNAIERNIKDQTVLPFIGFNWGVENDYKDVGNDTFADALSSFIILGADMHTLQIGMFDQDIRLQFNVGNNKKTILYRHARIDEGFSRRGSDNYLWTKNCFDGFAEGPTALIVKADFFRISHYVVDALDPDIIVGQNELLKDIKEQFPQFSFSSIDITAIPYPDMKWSYETMAEIEIGRKTQV